MAPPLTACTPIHLPSTPSRTPAPARLLPLILTLPGAQAGWSADRVAQDRAALRGLLPLRHEFGHAQGGPRQEGRARRPATPSPFDPPSGHGEPRDQRKRRRRQRLPAHGPRRAQRAGDAPLPSACSCAPSLQACSLHPACTSPRAQPATSSTQPTAPAPPPPPLQVPVFYSERVVLQEEGGGSSFPFFFSKVASSPDLSPNLNPYPP